MKGFTQYIKDGWAYATHMIDNMNTNLIEEQLKLKA